MKENDLLSSLRSLFEKEELLANVIDFFPYPIQIYAPDGTSVLVNKAMLKEYHTLNSDAVVGKYNIFNDPDIIATGQIDVIKKAFKGETVFFSDIKVPLEQIAKRYGIKDFDITAVYQDITLFPISDDSGNVVYVGSILINRRIYRGKEEIEKAKEFIETNWLEPFNLDNTAKAACLSKSHFMKLFKKHTGMTPYEYYINYKIKRLKSKLLDQNLSISQAYSACNLNYNGHFARLFREKVGMSPSEYRKNTFPT